MINYDNVWCHFRGQVHPTPTQFNLYELFILFCYEFYFLLAFKLGTIDQGQLKNHEKINTGHCESMGLYYDTMRFSVL